MPFNKFPVPTANSSQVLAHKLQVTNTQGCWLTSHNIPPHPHNKVQYGVWGRIWWLCFAHAKQGKKTRQQKGEREQRTSLVLRSCLCPVGWSWDKKWEWKRGKRTWGGLIWSLLQLTWCMPLMWPRFFALFSSLMHSQPSSRKGAGGWDWEQVSRWSRKLIQHGTAPAPQDPVLWSHLS